MSQPFDRPAGTGTSKRIDGTRAHLESAATELRASIENSKQEERALAERRKRAEESLARIEARLKR